MGNHLDQAILAVTPVVVAPKFGVLENIGTNAQRYIVGAEGLFLEVRRPWLHVVHRVAATSASAPTPYGAVRESTKILCGIPPAAMLERFMHECVEEAPDEHAAWITWHERTGQFRYRPNSGVATPDSITFQRPELEEGEWCVLDMHSHGNGHAFFSGQDDRDDFGEVKQALVLGRVLANPSFIGRLCVLGNFIRFNPWIEVQQKEAA